MNHSIGPTGDRRVGKEMATRIEDESQYHRAYW